MIRYGSMKFRPFIDIIPRKRYNIEYNKNVRCIPMSYCQDCRNPIEAEHPSVQCPQCGAVYHQECWDKNGGCIVSGCGYQAEAAPAVQEAPVQEAPEAPAAPVVPADQYICRQCGTPLQDNQYICPTCGVARRRSAPPAPAAAQCPGCGAELAPNQRFCGKCGYTLQPQQPQQPAYQPQPAYQQPVYQQSAYQPDYQQPAYQPVQPQQKTPAMGLGVTGMVLGIVGIVFCWFLCFGFILSVVGLILSIVAKKKGCTGVATAGIICSAIGMGIGLIFTIAWVVGAIAAASYSSSYYW